MKEETLDRTVWRRLGGDYGPVVTKIAEEVSKSLEIITHNLTTQTDPLSVLKVQVEPTWCNR